MVTAPRFDVPSTPEGPGSRRVSGMLYADGGRRTFVVAYKSVTCLNTYRARKPKPCPNSRSKLAVDSLIIGCFRLLLSALVVTAFVLTKSGPLVSRFTSPGSQR